jgi:hypothetical protein
MAGHAMKEKAAQVFASLLAREKENLAYVYHKKPNGHHALRGFHPNVLLSVVIQTLASEDDVHGWPLFLDVGKHRYRALVPVDLPWLHAMQLLLARPLFPLNAAPATFTFRYLSQAEQRAMVAADPLPVEIQERAPRPPRKNKDARNCVLQPFADDYMAANCSVDGSTCLVDD